MTFQLIRPDSLPPDALDALLASGWYRMRQSVFTCRYLLGPRGLHSAVWTRLPLRGYRFRASHRRRLKHLHQRFRVEIVDQGPDGEHEELYERYVAHVQGERPESLRETLFDEDGQGLPLFRTRQVSVRDEVGRLVACSFFDEGRESLQSVVGIYDPAHARHGLGMATMLEEIRYGLSGGFRFHYAGYVVPGVPSFDYKREVGELQYYDADRHHWRALSELDEEALVSVRLQKGLQVASALLAQAGIPHRLRSYPPYRVVFANELQHRCVSAPLFLECGRAGDDNVSLVLSFDPVSGTYCLDACQRGRDLTELMGESPRPESGLKADLCLLVRLDRAGSTESAEQAVRWVGRALGRGPWRCVSPD